MARKFKFKPGDFIVSNKYKYVMKVVQCRYSQNAYLLYPIKFDNRPIKEIFENSGINIHSKFAKKDRIWGNINLVNDNWHKIEMDAQIIKVLYGKSSKI